MTDGGREGKRSYDVTITERHAKRLEREYEALSITEALRTSSEEALLCRESLLTEEVLREAVADAVRESD